MIQQRIPAGQTWLRGQCTETSECGCVKRAREAGRQLDGEADALLRPKPQRWGIRLHPRRPEGLRQRAVTGGQSSVTGGKGGGRSRPNQGTKDSLRGAETAPPQSPRLSGPTRLQLMQQLRTCQITALTP